MTDMAPIVDEAATRLAFGLLRAAYIDLAHTLRSIEEAAAVELLNAVEFRTNYRLGCSGEDDPDGVQKQTALGLAAGRVRAVLREAREN